MLFPDSSWVHNEARTRRKTNGLIYEEAQVKNVPTDFLASDKKMEKNSNAKTCIYRCKWKRKIREINAGGNARRGGPRCCVLSSWYSCAQRVCWLLFTSSWTRWDERLFKMFLSMHPLRVKPCRRPYHSQHSGFMFCEIYGLSTRCCLSRMLSPVRGPFGHTQFALYTVGGNLCTRLRTLVHVCIYILCIGMEYTVL